MKKGRKSTNQPTNLQFKRKLIASAVASTLLGGSTLVAAQGGSSGDVLEEVVVTGIRGSLQRSMDIKRDALGVVDAITAEDIGKFPDSNLAESLQRVSGLSIDRRNGEGFQVTARGFGPEYNQITLNGRIMPVSQVDEGGGLNTSRSFDMSNIAAEGVSGVVVYKSTQADIASGGIGATIDLQTRKPFQNEGFVSSVGLKILNDSTSRVGDDYTPELSGFVSWSNDMWGVSLSASHQERDSARTGAFVNGYNDYSAPWKVGTEHELERDSEGRPRLDMNGMEIPTGMTRDQYENIPNDVKAGAGFTNDVEIVNAPAAGTQTNFINGLRYTHVDFERERQNAQITVQFRPRDDIEATLDYATATQTIEGNRNEHSFWFGGGAFPTSAVQFQQSDGVATPLYWLTEDAGQVPRDVNNGFQGINIENELESIGLNLAWDINEDMKLRFDVHQSEAKTGPGSHGISAWYNVNAAGQGVPVQGVDFSGDLPLLVGIWKERPLGGTGTRPSGGQSFGPGNTAGVFDKGDLSGTVRQIANPRIESELTQARLDFEWNLDESSTVDFGIESRDMEHTSRRSWLQETLLGGWGATNTGDIPADMVDNLNFHSLFDGYSSNASAGAIAFFRDHYDEAAGSDDEITTFGANAFISDNPNAIGARLSQEAGLVWAPNPVDGTDRVIEEEILSLYAQLEMSGETEYFGWRMLAGFRYEETEVSSAARVATRSITWQGDNDFTTRDGDAATAPTLVNSAAYDHFLPSFSLALDVTEDIVVRAGWSKTIARADYASLQHGLSEIGAPRGGPTILGGRPGGARNGIVGLLPVESDNFDLGVEWYYDESSYVSLGWFEKRVPNFIGNQAMTVTAESTRDPSNGPRAQAAKTALERMGIEVNQQNLFRMVAALHGEDQGCVNTKTMNLCGQGFDAAGIYDSGQPELNRTHYEIWENNVDIDAVNEGSLQDPLSVLEADTPVNANDAEISGWELSAQHFFWDTGIGVQANYTLVDGTVEYDVDRTGNAAQFALTGLGDSANVVLLYEKHGISARLAWNWRDSFLNSANVGGNEPEFTEEYEQWDFSVGYQVMENLQVVLEGINITDEDIRRHGRTEAQFRSLDILGARYSLSARYNF